MSDGSMQATVSPNLPQHVCTVERIEVLARAGFSFQCEGDSLYFFVREDLKDFDGEHHDVEIPWRETLQLMRDEANHSELIVEGAYTHTKMRPGEFGGFVYYFTKHGVQESNTRSMLEGFAAENRLLFIDAEERNRNAARYLADYVNRGILKPEIFAAETVNHAHRTLQQLMMRLFWACIKAWAKAAKNRQFDMRNQATVSLCSEIVDKVGEDQHFPYV